MTRKRFIKLLMAKGIQRNEAAKTANLYNARKIPYSRAIIVASVSHSFAELAKAIKNFGTNAAKCSNAFANLKRSFDNATQ